MGNALLSEPQMPGAEDVAQAQEATRALARLVAEMPKAELALEDNGHRVHVVLPRAAVQLLQDILREMSQGHAVTLIPVHAELTTQQAADLLNVSRPHLIHLLDDGAIPYTKTGTHRRIRFDDVIRYKLARDAEREQALDELSRLNQEMGLYDA